MDGTINESHEDTSLCSTGVDDHEWRSKTHNGADCYEWPKCNGDAVIHAESSSVCTLEISGYGGS